MQTMCKECHGAGDYEHTPGEHNTWTLCPECGGKGWVYVVEGKEEVGDE